MSKIALERSQQMFDFAGVDRERMLCALRVMGATHLKTKQMRDEYDPENPTRNYCYVVAEFVYTFVAPPGSTSWLLAVEGYDTWHRFVKWPDGTVVDLSAEQFPDYSKVVYQNAKRQGFQYPSPSFRARLLARLLGWHFPLGEGPLFAGNEKLANVDPRWSRPDFEGQVPVGAGAK